MTLTLVEYLADKGVQTWKASGPEVTAWCFFCGRHQRDKGRLYINTKEGVYFCQVCQASGAYRDILEHFGDKPDIVSAPGADDALARRRILEAATRIGTEGLLNNDDVLAWLMGNDRSLRQRGLSVETIESTRLGYLAPKWSLVRSLQIPHDRRQLLDSGLVWRDDTETHRMGDDFFRGPKILIPYLSNGGVVQIRGRDWPDGKYQTGPGEAVRLYGLDTLHGATEAIVVEGEFDQMVLRQALALCPDARWRNVAVVALPGAGSWQSGWEDYFRNCRRVFVAMDPDEAGRRGAIKVKDALGTRARIVDLPEDLPKCDWTEYLVYRKHGWRDVLELLTKSATTGRRVFTFSESFDALRARRASQRVYPTGYVELDAAIDGGGMTGGSVSIVAAKTAVGKTLFAGNVIVNHRRLDLRVPTLVVSLEMTRAEFVERLARQWRFYHPYAGDDELRAVFDDNLMICDLNRIAGKELTTLIGEYEEEMGVPAEFVVVDYLGYFARGQSGKDQYERTTNAVMELKAVAKETDASLLVPAQVNRAAKAGEALGDDSLRDSGAIEETADYLITLWRPDDALAPEETVERSHALQASLAKNRRGPKGQRLKMGYALGSLAIVDPTDTAAMFRATQENRAIMSGKTYADIRRQYEQDALTPDLRVVR